MQEESTEPGRRKHETARRNEPGIPGIATALRGYAFETLNFDPK